MNRKNPGTVLVVDDNAFVLDTTKLLLAGSGHDVTACLGAEEALEKFKDTRFDCVLTDIKMPRVSGIELLERVHAIDREIPVILMTAYAELDVAVNAIKKGAMDFIIKPYRSEYLLHAVDKAINFYRLQQMEKNYKKRLEDEVIKRTSELAEALRLIKDMSREIAHRLTAVAEYRDAHTAGHIRRIGLYSGAIARALNKDEDYVETITFASAMHDIGKIGIPDTILLKKNELTKEEFDVMKLHTVIGERMLIDSPYPTLQMAATIAISHHERWGGGGYPNGLKAEAIPLEGRIVMLADQYDALRSKRPYKGPYGHERVIEIITIGDVRTMPGHFDPQVLKVFKGLYSVFEEIFRTHQD